MRLSPRLALALLLVDASTTYALSPVEDLKDLGKEALLAAGSVRHKASRFLSQHFESHKTSGSDAQGTYAPIINAQCPPAPFVRQPKSGEPTLSSDERDWVASRRAKVVSAWSSYLNNPAISNSLGADFDVNAFLADTEDLPTVGIAASGGGYRAMIHGAGVISALDSRNPKAVEQGTGGILQLTTYISGLSGGSWLVGSLAAAGFPSIADMLNVWDLRDSLVDPSGIVDLIEYYVGLEEEVNQKAKQGFDVSITDYWGRAISHHLINNPTHGLGTTYSSIRNLTSFATHDSPFPIIISNERPPGQLIVPINTTIYEYTPFEFGSRNSDLEAFIPMEHLGTSAVNGAPQTETSCVLGYDNVGFVMGTSGSLFNVLIYSYIHSSSKLKDIFGDLLDKILGKDNDIATYPNPFQGLDGTKFDDSTAKELSLVDGGEDGEVIPFWPLLDLERKVDVIIAMDGSADTLYDWPNGTSVIETQKRMQNPDLAPLASFPPVPTTADTFVEQGFNSRPTFFGCPSPSSSLPLPPLVIYIPNTPHTSYTNYSTYKFTYNDTERDTFLANAFEEVGPAPSDSEDLAFPTCFACALVSRKRSGGNELNEVCGKCFEKYCWDGKESASAGGLVFDPQVETEAPAVGGKVVREDL